MKLIKIAVVKDGVVSRIEMQMMAVGDDEIAVVSDTAKKNDLYDGIKFSTNPDAAKLLEIELKKKEIAATLKDIKTDAELKAAIAAINNDVNP